jgi:hypothetical protein
MAAERARVDQGGAVEQRPVVGHIEERWNTAAAPSDADDVTADSASVATATVSVAAASTAASTDASTDVPFVMGADLPRPPGMPGMVPPGYNTALDLSLRNVPVSPLSRQWIQKPVSLSYVPVSHA